MDFFDVCTSAEVLISDVFFLEHALETICSNFPPTSDHYPTDEEFDAAYRLHGGLEFAARRALAHIKAELDTMSTAYFKWRAREEHAVAAAHMTHGDK